jgi:hypothetical protein
MAMRRHGQGLGGLKWPSWLQAKVSRQSAMSHRGVLWRLERQCWRAHEVAARIVLSKFQIQQPQLQPKETQNWLF